MSRNILSFFSPRTHRIDRPTHESVASAAAPEMEETSTAEEDNLANPGTTLRSSLPAKRSLSPEFLPPPKRTRRLRYVAIPIPGRPKTSPAMPTPPESSSDNGTSRPRRAAANRAPAKQSPYLEWPESEQEEEGDLEPDELSEYAGSNNDGSVHDASEDQSESASADEVTEDDAMEDASSEAEEQLQLKHKRNVKSKAEWNSLFSGGAASKKSDKIRANTADTASWKFKEIIELDSPPISDINEIFDDITKQALSNGLQDTLRRLQGRELRVATMCSGTESPLLALQLVAQSLQKMGHAPLKVNHLFSAEIVPYKQAFIERNFSPPIIFRDIREFTREGAKTTGATNVYGAKTPIPDNVDLLVAGFSCVDFSNLNIKKKDLEDGGESGDTFEAVHRYADLWRPRIIVLENVKSAPWVSVKNKKEKSIKDRMDAIGYECEHIALDTKHYYLPHTRQRGYMVCIDRRSYGKDSANAVRRWKTVMKSMEFHASAPVSSFLLPTDDSRVEQLNAELSRQMRSTTTKRNVKWEACAIRHDKTRHSRRLGNMHPITDWVANGSCNAFEYANKLWLQKQGERVWDTIDIGCMTGALDKYNGGFDVLYKTLVMELSQNVDRGNPIPNFGICPCITPSGIHFLTDRGGPLTAYELLALQGIPLDKISFTTETSAQLQDLAGNAMSSTVVGVAEIAALIVAGKVLDSTGSPPTETEVLQDEGVQMCGKALLAPYKLAPCKDERETPTPLNSMSLFEDAMASNRRCVCEGQLTETDRKVYRCMSCDNTVCSSCKRKPKHDYYESPTSHRISPQSFENRWKSAFPTSFRFTGPPKVSTSLWGTDQKTITRAFEDDLVFTQFKRGPSWKIIYESPKATLELHISEEPEWRLYAKPHSNLPGNHRVRQLLVHEIARARLPETFLESKEYFENWQWFQAEEQSYELVIEHRGVHMPSWRSQFGLLDYANEQINSKLEIACKVPVKSRDVLSEDVSGLYEHLPECGTASASLYRRITPSSASDSPLYLFLDPAKLGDPAKDTFVFSHEHRRLEYGETRSIIGSIAPSWRPWYRTDCNKPGPDNKHTKFLSMGHWVPDSNMQNNIQAISDPLQIWSPPTENTSWERAASADGCTQALMVLAVEVSPDTPIDLGNRGVRQANEDDTRFFQDWAWILHQVRHVPQLKQWRSLGQSELCFECGPEAPKIVWRPELKNGKATLIPQEEPEQAGRYEKAIKHRKRILHLEESRTSEKALRLEIGINIMALAHRARSRLRSENAEMAWNLVTDYVPSASPRLEPFTLRDNNKDKEYETPAGFKYALKPSQKRSLAWMKRQEAGAQFQVEEVEEAVIEPLRWKVEARAQATIDVKGGVLADEVSYGKTVTTLALIHSDFLDAKSDAGKKQATICADTKLIDLKATLIIAPANLPGQWFGEINKFLGNKEYGPGAVLLIKTMADLQKLTIRHFLNAKIIIFTWTILTADKYMERLQDLTAMPEAPSTEGRAFNAWLDYALKRMPALVDTLTQQGPRGFQDSLQELSRQNDNNDDFNGIVPSKRRRGQAYVDSRAGPKSGKASSKVSGKTSGSSKSKSVASGIADWKDLQCPVLNMFRFNRLVIDEFTYPKRKGFASLMVLQADKRWVLSGTPPLDDFADVKRIGSFLGVNLGIDCDAPFFITRANAKAMQEDQTNTEKFQAFRQKRSAAWHARRHEYAQSFLDCFVRQNEADIGSVECFEHLKPVNLRADHRVAYIELLQHLNASSMQMMRPNEPTDKMRRIKEAMADTSTAEEALSKCSSYHMHTGTKFGLDVMIEIRQKEFEAQVKKLKGLLLDAEQIHGTLRDTDNAYANFKSTYRAGDPDVHRVLKHAIDNTLSKESKKKFDENHQNNGQLKLKVRGLRTAVLDLVARQRALRFLTTYKTLRDEPQCDGKNCKERSLGLSDLAVFTECGHRACVSCIAGREQRETNDEAAGLETPDEFQATSSSNGCVVDRCLAAIQDHHILSAGDISEEDSPPDDTNYGQKLEEVLELLQDKSQVQAEDRAILFVQSYVIMDLVQNALELADISYYAIDNTKEGAKRTDLFVSATSPKDPQWRQVIILNLSDESAAGLNLTMCNHVLFLAPLLEDTFTKYHAAMTQAIGRARRYGQKKPVHIYRFAALNTIDVDVLEHRERRATALREGKQPMAPPYLPIVRRTARAEGGNDEHEKTKLVRDSKGLVALIPISWTTDPGLAARNGVKLEGEPKSLTSLMTFSDAFAGESEE